MDAVSGLHYAPSGPCTTYVVTPLAPNQMCESVADDGYTRRDGSFDLTDLPTIETLRF